MSDFTGTPVNKYLPERIGKLAELSYNLWFSWHSQARKLFKLIDAALWEDVYCNPVLFLRRVCPQKLDTVAQDPQYLVQYDQLIASFDQYMSAEKWFQKQYPWNTKHQIAYFSAEFALHDSLPVYSGGLGVLAGDHSKAASDLGLPFVGVGLLYKQGYINQRVDNQCWQQAEYSNLDFSEMPVKPAVGDDGQDIIVSLTLPHRTLFIKIWQVQVGRICLYLLDTDIDLNNSEDRLLTGQLYGGDNEMRILQEIILGIGGVKTLRAIGINPSAWHINEGHAAFLCVERVRELVAQGVALTTAKETVKATTLFTTHTPVPAGHDIFDTNMVDHYLHQTYSDLGMERAEFMELGQAAGEGDDSFNMSLLAINLSGYKNGVSKLHSAVSRKMFQHAFKYIPLEEVPIYAITNGVHTKTWLAQEFADLFNQYLGGNWADNMADAQIWQRVEDIPNDQLWAVHQNLKQKTINYTRKVVKEQWLRNQESLETVLGIADFLKPEALTIGFARRFATYKRADLIFTDKQRLEQLLNNNERPVQIIFAGKAHPQDQQGKEMVKKICRISKEEQFKGKILFLENYNMQMATHLVRGVDIWLNNPRRLEEASGTSGMKAGINAVLNFSILDGWWPEAYNGQNGFAVGTEKTLACTEEQDRADAAYLYALLEEVVIPTYYEREQGLPLKWLAHMKACWRTITWQFSTERMVQDYTEKFYMQCINNYSKMILDYKLASERTG
ncbi:MAG: alpha-glucan family phosphorylase [Desulfotomaculum sp.]|nr:alpha-glucan family phosphorylase [Desulfotomaculum sp.]